MFEKILKFYKMGLYSAEQVKAFADKGIITQEQYEEIVG